MAFHAVCNISGDQRMRDTSINEWDDPPPKPLTRSNFWLIGNNRFCQMVHNGQWRSLCGKSSRDSPAGASCRIRDGLPYLGFLCPYPVSLDRFAILISIVWSTINIGRHDPLNRSRFPNETHVEPDQHEAVRPNCQPRILDYNVLYFQSDSIRRLQIIVDHYMRCLYSVLRWSWKRDSALVATESCR